MQIRRPLKSDSDQNASFSAKRIRMTMIGCTVVCIGFAGLFGYRYGIRPVIDSSINAYVNSITYQTIQDYAMEGDYLDRNGNQIMTCQTPGTSATAQYPQNYSFAYLLGYYSVSGMQENMYGLRGNLKDYTLFHLDENNKGASIHLTVDIGLQNYCWQLLNQIDGSIIVLDNETGAILALASNSLVDYDVNDVNTLLDSDVEGSQYRRGTYETDPPGSTFKIVTAVAALTKQKEEGLDDSWFDYTDYGSYYAEGSDFRITNWADLVYGQITLEKAMNSSVNTYFADLGVRTGKEQLEKTAEKFLIGKDIEIPFLTTIHSSMDIGNRQIELAQASFGQGKTQITPLHIAMITQSVANNGHMMQPYIVSSIGDGKIPLYKAFPHRLSTTMDTDVNEKLKQILHSTAVGYGFDEYTYGNVYAKTGTAECVNDRIHTYITGFTDEYTFVVSYNNSSISTVNVPAAQALVQYLNNVNYPDSKESELVTHSYGPGVITW